ncbi:MAG: hypothetical protein KDE22_06095, partial [Rhodobacterales bacterium]|nr:hypothetical protein [Rhodobacterales bacterium]
MTFRVAIRADASDRIGGGHVGRCLALAQVLRGWGCEVRFIGRDRPGFPADRVRRAGFDLRLVGDGEGDLTAPVDLLVVDAYHLDRVWESVQRPRAAAIAVIDDLADRPHDGDWLIDAGRPDGSAYVGLTEAPVLAGPRFALLRREFEAARRRQDDTDGVPEGDGRLVLFFGAADRSGLSAVALDALSLLGADAPPADLVVTSANPRAEALA